MSYVELRGSLIRSKSFVVLKRLTLKALSQLQQTILELFFFIFQRKQGLKFHMNCLLSRQIT